MTYSAGGNGTEIDFLPVGKENRKYFPDVKVIPGELQHKLVVMDLVKKVKKVVRKKAVEKRKVWKLKEDDTRARFEGRVGKLVNTDAPDLWKCFKEGVLMGVMKCVGRRMKGGIKGTHSGGTRM